MVALLGLTEGEEAAAQVEVGGRTVCDGRAGAGTVVAFGGGEVDAVRQDGTGAEQTVVVVDVEVAVAVGEEGADPGDLVAVLRDVGVHEGGGVGRAQGTRRFELVRGAGGGEARGDGVEVAAVAVPALDE